MKLPPHKHALIRKDVCSCTVFAVNETCVADTPVAASECSSGVYASAAAKEIWMSLHRQNKAHLFFFSFYQALYFLSIKFPILAKHSWGRLQRSETQIWCRIKLHSASCCSLLSCSACWTAHLFWYQSLSVNVSWIGFPFERTASAACNT